MIQILPRKPIPNHQPLILDYPHRRLRHQPDVRPLVANAAAAIAGRGDVLAVGGVDFIDEGAAVAVTAVGARGSRGGSWGCHCGWLQYYCVLMSEKRWNWL